MLVFFTCINWSLEAEAVCFFFAMLGVAGPCLRCTAQLQAATATFVAMKSAYRDRYGPPLVLSIRELPVPAPKEGEIRIRVRAATVNRTDCAILLGKPFVMRFFCGLRRPRHHASGTDFAGEVEAVGSGVNRFKVGDRVWGFDDAGLGSHSQQMLLRQDKAVAKMPAGIGFEQAAASIEGAHYAYNFINKVKLKAGQTALLNGASGAIGSALLQLLKHFGLQVTATCATPQLMRIKALGADRVIDYLQQDFTQEQGRQFDYVFDAVGKSSFAACRPLLRPAGIYISSELGAYLQNPLLALLSPILPGPKVIFPVPFRPLESMAFVGGLLERGEFKPLIDRSMPFEQIAAAFDLALSGQKVGNLLLSLD